MRLNLTPIFLFFFFFTTSFAQDNNVVLTTKKIELSLIEYLKKVRQYSLGIKVEEHNPDLKKAEYHEAKDINATKLTSAYSYGNNNTTGFGASGKSQSFDVGINKRFIATGTSIGMNYKHGRSPLLNASVATNLGTVPILSFASGEQSQSELSFNLNQSLLRNGPIKLSGKIALDIARANVKLEKSIFNESLENLIKTALELYWSYQLNLKDYQFALSSYEDAKEIEKLNENKVEIGTIERSTYYESQAAVVEKKADVIRIGNELTRLKENILFLMGYSEIVDVDEDLVFIDALEYKEIEIDKTSIYLNASKYSKKLIRNKMTVDISRMALTQAKITMLPKLDFNFSYVFKGTSTNDPGISKASGDLFNDIGNSADWFIGLSLETPLNPKAIKTVKERAEVTFLQAKDALAKSEQDLRLTLNRSVRNVEYQSQVTKDNEVAVAVMEKSRDEYRKDFSRGKIDYKTFVDADGRLTQWRRKHLQSIYDFEVAKANLDIIQGIFLSNLGIQELDVNARVK